MNKRARDRESDLFMVKNLIPALATDQILTPAGAAQRELALETLPALLPQFGLNEVAIDQLCAAYMMCSYGASAKKHAIKRAINDMFRREMEQHGGCVRDMPSHFQRAKPVGVKPVCVVVTNHFAPTHAMYRCFGKSIRELRGEFEVVNLSLGLQHQDSVRLFDRVINFQMMPAPDFLDNIALAAKVVREAAPDVLLYADIAMHPVGIFLSNLRLAPIQATIPGHPVSSYSREIDYFFCEEAVAPYTADFTEKVIAYPDKDYTLSKPAHPPLDPHRKQGEFVNIMVPATIPKLNAEFLGTCQEIADRHGATQLFITTNAQPGPEFERARAAILAICPRAKVLAAMMYSELIGEISECDMFLLPYPFAGTNLTVDCLSQGLLGITMGGSEILSMTASTIIGKHNLSEERYTARSREEWYTARSREEYIKQALQLAIKPKFRQDMRKLMCERFARDTFWLYGERSPGLKNAIKGVLK